MAFPNGFQHEVRQKRTNVLPLRPNYNTDYKGKNSTWCQTRFDALTVVESDNVQAVEDLSLILMDPLDVDVKDGLRIDLHLVLNLQVRCKLLLALLRRIKIGQIKAEFNEKI